MLSVETTVVVTVEDIVDKLAPVAKCGVWVIAKVIGMPTDGGATEITRGSESVTLNSGLC